MIYGLESQERAPHMIVFADTKKEAKQELIKNLNDCYFCDGVFTTENSFDDNIYLYSDVRDATPKQIFDVIDMSDLSDDYDYILYKTKQITGNDFNSCDSWQWEYVTDSGWPIHGNPIYTKEEFAQSLIYDIYDGFIL